MWIIVKIKTREVNIFKDNLRLLFNGDVIFYRPKVIYNKNNNPNQFIKYILGDYIFCNHKNFKYKNELFKIQNVRGLKYILNGNFANGEDVEKFIDNCKKNEDHNGSLKQNFFNNLLNEKAKFITGPLSNLVFEIIKNEKNNIEAIFNKDKKIIFNKKNNSILIPA